MTNRQDYHVHATGADPDLAAVCAAVYDAVLARIDIAHIDAFSDFHEQMPADIKKVESRLRELSATQTRRGTGMRIRVRPTDSPGWDFVRAYTPWSIHVEAFDASMKTIARFHDCGYSIIVFLDEGEAEALRSALPAGHELEPLITMPDEESAPIGERRRTRLGRRLRR